MDIYFLYLELQKNYNSNLTKISFGFSKTTHNRQYEKKKRHAHRMIEINTRRLEACTIKTFCFSSLQHKKKISFLIFISSTIQSMVKTTVNNTKHKMNNEATKISSAAKRITQNSVDDDSSEIYIVFYVSSSWILLDEPFSWAWNCVRVCFPFKPHCDVPI